MKPVTKYILGGLFVVSALSSLGGRPKEEAPRPPADPEWNMTADGIVKCRTLVRHRFPGADLPGVLSTPPIEKVSSKLWRWRETGVLNGVRFGYRCRMNPQVPANLMVSDDDEIPYPAE